MPFGERTKLRTKSLSEDCLGLVDVASEDGCLPVPDISQDRDGTAVSPSRGRQAPPDNLCTTTTANQSSVELISPANLLPGYQFVVKCNDQEHLVQVPPSGATQGQRFSAVIVPVDVECPRAFIGHRIPHGFWRDGLLDCFSLGIFHPVWCLACCAPYLLLSQIMTRLGLDTWGKPVKTNKDDAMMTWSPFRNICTIFLSHFILIETALSAIVVFRIHARDDGYGPVPTWAYFFLAVRAACRIMLFVYFLVVSVRTRSHVRERFAIPENHCPGQEDLLVSAFCIPLSITQMARHTADYETYVALCCTPTGLSEYAPSPV